MFTEGNVYAKKIAEKNKKSDVSKINCADYECKNWSDGLCTVSVVTVEEGRCMNKESRERKEMPIITSIYITAIENKEGTYSLAVIFGDDEEDFFTTTGFYSIDECWDYARAFAKVFGLKEEDINADIYEQKLDDIT